MMEDLKRGIAANTVRLVGIEHRLERVEARAGWMALAGGAIGGLAQTLPWFLEHVPPLFGWAPILFP